jgi:hypothetical protein
MPPDISPDNPYSLANILPSYVKEAVALLTEEEMNLSDLDSTNALFPKDKYPDGVPSEFYRLRLAFWDEYDRCGRYQEPVMDMAKVLMGNMSPGAFVKNLDSKLFLAWLLHPPSGYTLGLKEIHDLSMRNLLAVIKLPITRADGRPDVKLIEAQFKIFQHADLRLKGAVVQKIEQRNLNVNVDATPKQLPLKSLSEIDDQIKALREQSRQLETPAQVPLNLMKLITPSAKPEIIDANAAQAQQPEELEAEIIESETSGR